MILSIQCHKCGRPLELPVAETNDAQAQVIARLILYEPCHPPAHEVIGRAKILPRAFQP